MASVASVKASTSGWDFADGGFGGFADLEFSAEGGAVGEGGAEVYVGEGGGEDASFDGEDAGDFADGLFETAGDLGEGGDEEVPETHALEGAAVESVLEEVVEELLGGPSREPPSNRYWKRSLRSCSEELSATRQFRMSPGGRTPRSLRSRPEERPVSECHGEAGSATDDDDPWGAAVVVVFEGADDVEDFVEAVDAVEWFFGLGVGLEGAVASVEESAGDDPQGVGCFYFDVDAVSDEEDLVGLEAVFSEEVFVAFLEEGASFGVVDDDFVEVGFEAEYSDFDLLSGVDSVGDEEESERVGLGGRVGSRVRVVCGRLPRVCMAFRPRRVPLRRAGARLRGVGRCSRRVCRRGRR